jgi:AcrR family transcriptional regulator
MSETALPRRPLTLDRVLAEATALADARGLAAVTMRALALRLDVRPMALYHHVAHKSALLDGLVDGVFAEMDAPTAGAPWRPEMTRRAHSARVVLRRHPWALGLLDSRRSPGPATLRHHDAMIATLRAAGFSLAATAQAYALLDAFVYGFVLQETSLPMEPDEPVAAFAEQMLTTMGEQYPALTEMARAMQPDYDFGDQFAPCLALVLDALARLAPPDQHP